MEKQRFAVRKNNQYVLQNGAPRVFLGPGPLKQFLDSEENARKSNRSERQSLKDMFPDIEIVEVENVNVIVRSAYPLSSFLKKHPKSGTKQTGKLVYKIRERETGKYLTKRGTWGSIGKTWSDRESAKDSLVNLIDSKKITSTIGVALNQFSDHYEFIELNLSTFAVKITDGVGVYFENQSK